MGRIVVVVALAAAACANSGTAPPTNASQFRLRQCSEPPVLLPAPPDAPQSRGCVATFTQELSDPAIIEDMGGSRVGRRYLVYAPPTLPSTPVPVVFVFPGRGSSAEAVAVYHTHTRFEALADRDGFVVVYGNGLPLAPSADEKPSAPKGGFLQGCFLGHEGEGIDVAYVRHIVAQLGRELAIDRSRIYATGISAGGGFAFELALEAPDLIAAIAPVTPVPFQPTGPWLRGCHAMAGYDRVSILMLAATDDRFVSYQPGAAPEYPAARYPGMEETRDAWLAALGIKGPATVEQLPDLVQGDSYPPHSGRTSSTVERQVYPRGKAGQEVWYYKVTGGGHAWPSPTQTVPAMWDRFGKANQDIDFSDHAWEFFQRHAKTTPK